MVWHCSTILAMPLSLSSVTSSTVAESGVFCLPGTLIFTVDKDNGIAKIVLQCQTISAEVLGLGCETVQVDLKTYEGIRIDKAALHIVNGQRGVYV